MCAKKRLTLVISSLGAGGAERVLSIMANYWVQKDWIITMFTFDDGSTPPFYTLASEVNHQHLNLSKNSANIVTGLFTNINRIQKLRTAIKNSQPDVVISFIDKTNILVSIALMRTGIPLVVSERIEPSAYSIGYVWRFARKLVYRHVNQIVVQSIDAQKFFSGYLSARTTVIPNPVLPSTETRKPTKSGNIILSIGRLDFQKGFDLLLSAFEQLTKQYPTWRLIIIGEGNLRTELKMLCRHLEIEPNVTFTGRIKNVAAYMKDAEFFVLSSRFEGFPNALCEAMAHSLPAISFDCPSGPSDIIRHNVDGLLIPPEDVPALSLAMKRLIEDEELRNTLAARAGEIVERFSLPKVMDMWEHVIEDVTNG